MPRVWSFYTGPRGGIKDYNRLGSLKDFSFNSFSLF